MPSSLLLTVSVYAVVLLCALCCCPSASAKYIYKQHYATDYANAPSNFFCAGSMTTVTSNSSTSVCQNGAINSQAYYCADNGAAYITITYGDINCQAGDVSSMTKTPTQCGIGSTSDAWKCEGTDPLPNGWTFPPAGWMYSTTQYNNTLVGSTGESVPACGSVNRPQTTQTAIRLYCRNDLDDSNSGKTSAQSYAGSDDSSSWFATFNQFDCQDENIVSLTQRFNSGCQFGVTSNPLPAGGPSPPAIPAGVRASRSSFLAKDGDSCSTLSSQVWYTGVCSKGQKTECVNSTTTNTYTYRESLWVQTPGGVCSGTQSTGYPVDRNITASNCNSGYSYQCATVTQPNSAAAAASISIVSMALVTLGALIFQ